MNKIQVALLEEFKELNLEAFVTTACELADEIDTDRSIEDFDLQDLYHQVRENNFIHEWFRDFDTYYSETAARGDSGIVAKAARELIEEDGNLDLGDFPRLNDLEGVERANFLVNLAAEVIGASMYPSYQEFETEITK